MNIRIPDSAEYVREIRRALKMTQQQFAKASGLNVRTLQKYELGLVKPGFEAMIRLEAMKKEIP